MINRSLDKPTIADTNAMVRNDSATPTVAQKIATPDTLLAKAENEAAKPTAPAAEPVAPEKADKLERASVRTKATSTPASERLPAADAPSAFRLGELSEDTAAMVAKFSTEFGRASVRDTQAQWGKLQYTVTNEKSDVDVNALMNWIVQNNIESRLSSRLQAGIKSALNAELARAREYLKNSTLGALTKQADGSMKTPGGYLLFNDGGRQWRVREPDGKEHRIWGDPHVDENNDGRDDWHFDRDASFVLPDGTKIFCDTVKVGEKGAGDITVSDQLIVQFGDQLGRMDVTKPGDCSVEDAGGVAYDLKNADGQMFVLGLDHAWKDGKTLGDLYDAGGDFVADVNADAKGAISSSAESVLAGGLPMGVFIAKQVGGTVAADGSVELQAGSVLAGRQAVEAYIDRLESALAELSHNRVPPGFDATTAMMQMQAQMRDNMRLAAILLASTSGGRAR